MRSLWSLDPGWGTALVRVVTALIFTVRGYEKLAAGMAAVTAGFAKMAIPLPGVSGPFIALLEVVGGVLLLLGLATRWTALLFAIEMLVAWLWVALPAGGWDGSELERLLFSTSVLLCLVGPGRLALDAAWQRSTS